MAHFTLGSETMRVTHHKLNTSKSISHYVIYPNGMTFLWFVFDHLYQLRIKREFLAR